jgi:hypothetical protein
MNAVLWKIRIGVRKVGVDVRKVVIAAGFTLP